MKQKFEDLPIFIDETIRDGEWSKTVKRETTISELLEIWDIDDVTDESEMAQVLRHLRAALAD